jgi:transketolase
LRNNKLIKRVVDLAYHSGEGHIASSLSILNIVEVMYHHVLDIDKTKNLIPDRDRFILSKGHGALALYAVLYESGLIPDHVTYGHWNSALGGHPIKNRVYGIEVSSGSLGHGLPIAVGMALGYKIRGYKSKIYCLVGDGECNEGSIWESVLLAVHHRLDNLTLIIDYNHSGDRAITYSNLLGMFTSAGFVGYEIDGHSELDLTWSFIFQHIDKPKVFVASTVKGKGIARMENNPAWHHRIPTEIEYGEIMEELCP